VAGFTSVEREIDAYGHRFPNRAPRGWARDRLTEFTVFVLKLGRASRFGAAMVGVLVASRI
jgi:hypothetical protein